METNKLPVWVNVCPPLSEVESLCLLLILSWIVDNLSGLLFSSCSRNFPLYVAGFLLVGVQLLPQLEVASADHSVVDLKALTCTVPSPKHSKTWSPQIQNQI